MIAPAFVMNNTHSLDFRSPTLMDALGIVLISAYLLTLTCVCLLCLERPRTALV